MNDVLVTHIEFARTILKIKGQCVEKAGEDQFFLRECHTGNSLPLPYVTVNNGVFFIEIPTLACNSERPLYSGDWYICIKTGGEEFINVGVTDALYDMIYRYTEPETETNLLINRSRHHYYRVFSKLQEPEYFLFFRVEYEVPKKTKNILKIWTKNVKSRHKKRVTLIRKGVFSVLFSFFNKTVKKTGNRVLFTSDSREEIGGNEEFVYRRMLARGLDQDYKIRFDFKGSITAKRSLKSKILFTYYLATSDYIFLDDYQPEIYLNQYDTSVKIIQLWHACGAFKTLGFERLGKNGAPPFNTKVHKCYTHVIVSSEHSAMHHAESFAIDRNKFFPIGIPRTDIFFDEDYKRDVQKRMQDEFPQIIDARKVILYAPTFRGNNAKDAYFPTYLLHLEKIGAYLEKTSSVMIIKMHPFVSGSLEIPEQYESCFIDASQYREVNDILFVTDLLITDYSSVIYEMALLGKPMLFYAFDLNQYVQDRGFYEPYEDTVPGKIVKTIPALIKALEEEDYESEKLQGFIEKNFSYMDGKATDRVIDLVFGD